MIPATTRWPVSFVGAGPGDPELLTLRAAARLRAADLILRDILVPESLLAALGTKAEVVNVGRLCGGHESQEARLQRIETYVVRGHEAGLRVVRLKSGDPMIFGRMAEELGVLLGAGVPFEVVPGITAGLAAASAAVVPLTERGLAPAALFCTGHLAQEQPPSEMESWIPLLRDGVTLVLYMGLNAVSSLLPPLCSRLAGQSIHLCAIACAGLPEQRVLECPLDEAASLLGQAGLPTPVVILIGRAARALHHRSLAGISMQATEARRG